MTSTTWQGRAGTRLLADYDSTTYGPLFAVSDEGSAGPVVVAAAYASAKAAADPAAASDPLLLGVILDGERMTSAGEVPIGPPEYAELSAAAAGKLLLTTNVGTRVNVRLTGQLPEFAAVPASGEAIVAEFQPFLHTPDKRPRPLTVRLNVTGVGFEPTGSLVRTLAEARTTGAIGQADVHRLSLLVVFDTEISTEAQLAQVETVITQATGLGIPEVAIDAAQLPYARRRWGGQGLLNVLGVAELNRLLAYASERKIRLVSRYQVDVESAARTIWTGLDAARLNGFDAGKYGLLPLTLEEQVSVIELVRRWTTGWTAIPAFYVDTPLVTESEVFSVDQCELAARRWLKAARGAGATIVLFDGPDRVTPRKLVKSADSPEGVLTPDQISALVDYGNLLGVKILWSGGITAPQAFELAQRGVCGIFTTSSTATKMAVTAEFERDPRLATENEPTEFGVVRMQAIIQGGFLTRRLRDVQADLAREICTATQAVVSSGSDATAATAALQALNPLLVQGWRQLRTATNGDLRPPQPGQGADGNPPVPVPADAVRVFRGRRIAGTAREGFVRRLEQVFMPMTVQMQRLYGLTAYLPAVPPASDIAGLPDEIALVFYRIQADYDEAKRCVGGRAYSALHDVAFDMGASLSGFPRLLATDEIIADQPYHLFERSVDWQTGSARVYLGTRSSRIDPAAFLTGIAEMARHVQTEPQGLDAAIFAANTEWMVWWDHSPTLTADAVHYFDALADTRWTAVPRLLRVPPDLTDPYSGLSLNPDGDFVNLQFPRL
ncbi:hypothetical protein FHT44_006302 [Mycolicibacterium sp. BK634]|uniref:hypothetical protein n=1 Tax=Mycolicibacterium sp. BK634 TaxID=2587099 RepID=UPI00161B1042|nr:hypothetical protein [Mycolicibacterium sp. BK634]MBB3753780.1 hypothetical protein [Mycolicibacterium sp. BK634]